MFRQDWVVYAKRPFGGPQHVLHYLARYTHRVAISNHRIVNFADGKVTFRWKDNAHKGKQQLMTVTGEEFLRRFLLHTLPRGFVRICFCGFLANRRRRELLPLCRQLLAAPLTRSTTPAPSEPKTPGSWICPRCGGTMTLIERLTPKQIRRRSAERKSAADTSSRHTSATSTLAAARTLEVCPSPTGKPRSDPKTHLQEAQTNLFDAAAAVAESYPHPLRQPQTTPTASRPIQHL